jgi:hypothetical protein
VFQETLRPFVILLQKGGVNDGEMMECLGLLVLSLNCQRGSLLVFLLAKFDDQNRCSKYQESSPMQDRQDAKKGSLDAIFCEKY